MRYAARSRRNAVQNKSAESAIIGSERSFPLTYMNFYTGLIIDRGEKYDGQTFWVGIFLYSIYRFLIEFYRTNPIFLYGLTHAQFFSIITLSISGFYLYFKKFSIARGKQPYVVWPLAGGLIVLADNPFLGIFLAPPLRMPGYLLTRCPECAERPPWC